MKRNFTAAAVDIGSHSTRMRLAEIKKDGTVKFIDEFKYPLALGKDSFSTGKISFGTAEELTVILSRFKLIMDEYRVSEYRITATSALRDAENSSYIIDQIKLRSGMEIEPLSNAQERYLTFKGLRQLVPGYSQIIEEGAMILDLGSGSIEISIYSGGILVFSQFLKMGALRISENLREIRERSPKYPHVLEEYIESNLDRLQSMERWPKIKHFIALGGNSRSSSSICRIFLKNPGISDSITKNDFMTAFRSLLRTAPDDLVRKYGLPERKAEVIIPSLIIIKTLWNMTGAKEMLTPDTSLNDGILYDMADRINVPSRENTSREDIYCSAVSLAKRLNYDSPHAMDVERKALKIFDRLKKLHGMKDRERLLLRLACVLHDTGKFLSFDRHYDFSHSIILASDILGISREGLLIIANTAKYHSTATPEGNPPPGFGDLSKKNRITTSKLIAIIRLADSLDRSHLQKLTIDRISLKENRLTLCCSAIKNTVLEEWTFEKKALYFKEVFGITPVLEVRKVIR